MTHALTLSVSLNLHSASHSIDSSLFSHLHFPQPKPESITYPSFNLTSKMPIDRQNMPPPVIGKIGRYTVFITPPPPITTPNSQSEPNHSSSPKPQFEQSSAERYVKERNVKAAPLSAPIMSPPVRSEKKMGVCQNGGSIAGMFWNAVNRVQLANSRIDDHLSRWFGLDQSKYQWAVDDYHQKKGMAKDEAKMHDVSSKV